MEAIKPILGKVRVVVCMAAMIAVAACMPVVTVDVNVHYVDQKLDDAFAFQQKYEQAPASRATTRDTTRPSSINAEKLP